ncbi:MAG: hypothetical protein IPG25_10870 [Proteobacteria bacterium]|nr:hypothetical protein [Pseudomonadota bacterium]
MTESAAWAARLRYAVADAEERIRTAHPEVTTIAIKVSPQREPATDSN